eukprot:TRINITY_DN119425_c0_g1_i1.p1 TRINITY_DN119425_c0_g1~~TRINITY_DN119425_c0_g1_i1.p1  ORF type:complete len:186 (+),score=40.70 TRINITY_DN119425_c0_g1_i1:317-874(+)
MSAAEAPPVQDYSAVPLEECSELEEEVVPAARTQSWFRRPMLGVVLVLSVCVAVTATARVYLGVFRTMFAGSNLRGDVDALQEKEASYTGVAPLSSGEVPKYECTFGMCDDLKGVVEYRNIMSVEECGRTVYADPKATGFIYKKDDKACTKITDGSCNIFENLSVLTWIRTFHVKTCTSMSAMRA